MIMANTCDCTRLAEQLNGAKMVRFDPDTGLTLVWFGGHGVHAYTSEGREVSFWNVGSFEADHASEKEVADSMDETIEEGTYP